MRGGGDAGPRGTGLGLAIVDAVANAHGATVTMTSLPEIDGTRFEVAFPAPPDSVSSSRTGAAAETAQQDESAAQTSTTTGRTIGRRRSRS